MPNVAVVPTALPKHEHWCGPFELGMLLQFLPGGRGEWGLAIDRLRHRLGASGAAGALEPGAWERLVEQGQGVGREGGFLFFAGGVSDADEETGQEECDPQHGAAGIGGHGAGTPRFEAAE